VWPLRLMATIQSKAECYYCSRSEVALESVERRRREREKWAGGD